MIYIGDTPEQLGSCLAAAAAVMIGNKIITKHQIAELIVQNAVLIEQLQIAHDCITCADETGYVQDVGFVDLEQVALDIKAVIDKSPTQHLRDVKAEAGRAGFVAGFIYALGETDEYDVEAAEFNGKQYAERVKAGE